MKINVLLVDDEKSFVEPLSERLRFRDFNVDTAFSGREALTIIEEKTVDVVVLDVRMPGLSGSETLRCIKESNPLIQVIMLTGQATVAVAIEDMKLGAYDFLMKPADIEALAVKITAAHGIKSDHERRIQEAEIGKIVGTKGW